MHAYRTHTCAQLRASNVGETVRLSGWIHRKRDHGGVLFIDLRDHYGLTQIVAAAGSEMLKQLEHLRSESVVTITGEVVARGDQVARWKVGDRICALTNGGGYAQYCTVDARHCLSVPGGVSLRDAGGLPETFFTVWSNIFMGAGLAAGETLLVHGGAGGIGTTAIQLARTFGARVIATDSPEERCAVCRDLGADRVIDYRREDFVEIMRGEGGANVILDIVGGPNIERNFKAASHDARIVQLAFPQGSKVEINLMPVMLKRLTYTGSTLRTRPPAFKAKVAGELEARVWPHIASGRIRTVTGRTFPLAEAAGAHALMESSRHTGKILLTVD